VMSICALMNPSGVIIVMAGRKTDENRSPTIPPDTYALVARIENECCEWRRIPEDPQMTWSRSIVLVPS